MSQFVLPQLCPFSIPRCAENASIYLMLKGLQFTEIMGLQPLPISRFGRLGVLFGAIFKGVGAPDGPSYNIGLLPMKFWRFTFIRVGFVKGDLEKGGCWSWRRSAKINFTVQKSAHCQNWSVASKTSAKKPRPWQVKQSPGQGQLKNAHVRQTQKDGHLICNSAQTKLYRQIPCYTNFQYTGINLCTCIYIYIYKHSA